MSELSADSSRRSRTATAKRRAAIAVALSACALSALVVVGTAPAQDISQRIASKQARIQAARAKEGVLTSTISRYSHKIGRLHGQVVALRNREFHVQGELDRRQQTLDGARRQLRRERSNLRRLRHQLKRSIKVLANRLVAIYKSDQPDILTVILESDGFADLVDRTEYMQRLGESDNHAVDRVRSLRNRSRHSVSRLADLERRVHEARDAIAAKRRELARTRGSLETRQGSLVGARAGRQKVLTSVQSKRHEYEGELETLQAEENRIRGTLNSAPQPGGNTPIGPVQGGQGGFIWPVSGPVVSPFGMRWGRLHAGVDIAATTGTPIRAAKAGVVALASPVSGYGNYACINHGGGISTCYAHMSAYATHVGAHLSQGDLVGYVGCTGHCFGPHLHFEVRIGGVPTNPMAYL